MRFVSFDTETWLIRPGMPAPRMVCASFKSVPPDDGIRTFHGSNCTALYNRDNSLGLLRELLHDYRVILIGHNIFYDLGVVCAENPATFVPLVFRAFEENRIRDTIVRQQLIDIACGDLKYRLDEETGEYVKTGYTLQDLAMRLLERVLPKEGTWRLRYALLDGVPISEWPEDAKKYAIDDAVTTWDCFWKQAELTSNTPEQRAAGGVIPTEERATREAWALWLMSAWGIRTDGEAVAKLRAELEAEQAEAMRKLANTGIYKKKRDGSLSKDMAVIYAKVEAGYKKLGIVPERTGTGRPPTDHEALEECGDLDLKILADASKGAKVLNTFVPLLEHGTRHAINARFNALVESYRTSCSKPNLQNLPRKGGARACFVARPGYVFASCDYDTIELRSLAQTCLDMLGESEMAEALKAGEDLHLNLAADFMGISREEAKARYEAGDVEVAEQRQLMKPANFGFPGGMSAGKFVAFAAGQGFEIDPELAAEIRKQWMDTWSEMQHYFNEVSDLVGAGEEKVTSERTGFVRGGMRFTQCANHFFQHLTATGAKDALWHVTKEAYNDRSSPLWGSRPVVFLHDEVISEVPEDRMHEAAERQAQIMVETMAKWIVDVPVKASPVLMRRWFKGAKPVRIDGRLVPSKPVEIEGKVKWVVDN